MATPRTPMKDFMFVPLKQIAVDAINQTRERAKKSKEFQKGIEELAESLLDNDLINPIIVKQVKGGYELHDGFRRRTAIEWLSDQLENKKIPTERKKLVEERLEQWNKVGIPVRLKEENVHDIALESNLHRENYSNFNIAQIIMKFIETGLDQQSVAKKIHRSPAWVSSMVSTYKKAGEALKNAWRDGTLPVESIMELALLPEDEQEDAVNEQASLRSSGSKEAKTKARAAAKEKGDGKRKQHRLRISDMKRYCKRFADLSGDGNPYLQGFVDAFVLAIGEMSEKELAEERKVFAKGLEDSKGKVRAKKVKAEKKAA